MPDPRFSCWVITDHAAGNQRQAFALAERLPVSITPWVVAPSAPWSWLSPRLSAGAEWSLPIEQRQRFAEPWPHVAIGCGRAGALYTRRLRELAGAACHTVQILDPRLDPEHWDTVIAPRHDRLSGANVIETLGSLNPIDDTWLQTGRTTWSQLGELPGPRWAVLLGGPRKGIAMDGSYAAKLAAGLHQRLKREGGSVLITASRRTPFALVEILRGLVHELPGICWSGAQDGNNPYQGVLGWADRLFVTPDSVNMLSEACATGVPVHTLLPEQALPEKIAHFHQSLRRLRLLHDLPDLTPPRQPALRETVDVAEQLQHRLASLLRA